jgi:hypothetical protein
MNLPGADLSIAERAVAIAGEILAAAPPVRQQRAGGASAAAARAIKDIAAAAFRRDSQNWSFLAE